MSPSLDQDKDSVTDDKTVHPRDKLIELLTDRGVVHVLDHSSRDQEKVAGSALDEGDQLSYSCFFHL